MDGMDGIRDGYAGTLMTVPGGPDGRERQRKTAADRGWRHPDGRPFDQKEALRAALLEQRAGALEQMKKVEAHLRDIEARLAELEPVPEPEPEPEREAEKTEPLPVNEAPAEEEAPEAPVEEESVVKSSRGRKK
jgi:hypothetical protein